VAKAHTGHALLKKLHKRVYALGHDCCICIYTILSLQRA